MRLRRGRNVASSSLSDSSSSEDSEDVMLEEKESGAIELRVGGLRICELLGRGARGCDPAEVVDGGVASAERLRVRT